MWLLLYTQLLDASLTRDKWERHSRDTVHFLFQGAALPYGRLQKVFSSTEDVLLRYQMAFLSLVATWLKYWRLSSWKSERGLAMPLAKKPAWLLTNGYLKVL